MQYPTLGQPLRHAAESQKSAEEFAQPDLFALVFFLMIRRPPRSPLFPNPTLFRSHMTGAGDVKLLAAVGAMVGCSDFVGIFLLTALIGGVLAIILVLVKGRLGAT